MSTVGQVERRTQTRVVKLLSEQLGYDYLGDWSERESNSNIDESLLLPFLREQGHSEELIKRALHQLRRIANNATRSLYDRNRDVYSLLRFGVQVKSDLDDLTKTVRLIDWEHPKRNQFAVAEEVTVGPADARAHGKRPDVVLYINGIAVAVLELKRSVVSVTEGIRQNIDSQKREFITLASVPAHLAFPLPHEDASDRDQSDSRREQPYGIAQAVHGQHQRDGREARRPGQDQQNRSRVAPEDCDDGTLASCVAAPQDGGPRRQEGRQDAAAESSVPSRRITGNRLHAPLSLNYITVVGKHSRKPRLPASGSLPRVSERATSPDQPSVDAVLGPLGASIMRILWSEGETTLATLIGSLSQRRRAPAYTTVTTILGRLRERGLVERSRHGREALYRAVVSEAELVEVSSERAVDALIARYGAPAMRRFAARLADVDPGLRRQLLALAQTRKPARNRQA